MFKKIIEKPFILEVEAGKRIPPLDETTRAAVTSLDSHPGFQYLIAKLRIERAIIESRLRSERHTDLASVAYLQAGVKYSRWLEDEVSRELQVKPRSAPSPLTLEEQAIYNAALATYEEVG